MRFPCRCKIKERQRLFKAFSLRFYVTVFLLTSLFSHHIFAEGNGEIYDLQFTRG